MREHRFDNSQTGGLLLILSDRFKKGSNTEFTVHFYLECKKRLKTIFYQFLTPKWRCDRGADHLIPGGVCFFSEKKDCSPNF